MRDSPVPSVKKIAWVYASLMVSAVAGGAGFVFMKEALVVFPASWFTFWRFFLSAVILFPFLAKKTWNALTPCALADVFTVGLLFCAATLIQLYGVARTDAGRSAFINSSGIVIIPMLQAALMHRAPSFKTLAGCFLCLFGVAFLAMQKITGHSDSWAEFFVFVGTFLFAVQLVTLKRIVKRYDPFVLSFMQFVFVALASLPVALFHPFSFLGSARGWEGIFYAAVVMNIGVLMVAYNALRYVSPTNLTVIGSTQALHGAFFGALLLNETITWQFAVSGGAIFAGILIAIFGEPSSRSAETS